MVNVKKTWTAKDVRNLNKMFTDDLSIDEIRKKLKRSAHSVKCKIHNIGLRRNPIKPTSPNKNNPYYVSREKKDLALSRKHEDTISEVRRLSGLFAGDRKISFDLGLTANEVVKIREKYRIASGSDQKFLKNKAANIQNIYEAAAVGTIDVEISKKLKFDAKTITKFRKEAKITSGSVVKDRKKRIEVEKSARIDRESNQVNKKCNLCSNTFVAANKFIRFCDPCRTKGPLRNRSSGLDEYDAGAFNRFKT